MPLICLLNILQRSDVITKEIENILIETDSPYLAPVPKRGKRKL